MKKYLPLIIIVVVGVTAIGGSWLAFRSRQSNTPTPFASQSPSPDGSASKATPTAEPVAIQKPTNLPAGLAVTVEEFGDYQCPPCGLLYPELKRIEQEYGERLHFVFRNLPLTKIHKNALVAAQAAEAARLQDRFVQMHDRLYERQTEWKDEANPRATFIRYAGQLGLDPERFDRDMDGSAVHQRLSEDQTRADGLGVLGTPTILIEGREMKPEVTNGEGIRKGIDLMLVKKAAAKAGNP